MFKKYLQFMFDWVDKRFPLSILYKEHLSEYYAPKNFNFWYFFGSLALGILVIQILSGIWLTMNYNPSSSGAFDSVEYIMRDVHYGWFLRYIHSTGASFFFFIIYLHMFRALLYGSYKKPRELIWIIGMIIYLCLMAEAFFGYLLPWGNMSFWGAQVITSLFGAVPYVGNFLMELIRGDYNVSGVTLTRFFSLHVSAIPLLLVCLVVIHLIALHEVGSNNPDGIEIKDIKGVDNKPIDGIPFHPYYTVKDIFGFNFFLCIFFFVVCFIPDFFGYFLESPNYTQADPLATPEHIAPVWYMTPYYAILRAIPNKLLGVFAMVLAIVVLFFLPWLDRSPVKSIRYKNILYKIILFVFIITFLGLGFLGMNPPSPLYTKLSQIFSVVYFSFFFFMPVYSRYSSFNAKCLPKRLL